MALSVGEKSGVDVHVEGACKANHVGDLAERDPARRSRNDARPSPSPRATSRRVTDVYHHIVCRHQVEIEVWPPRAEIIFRDDGPQLATNRRSASRRQVYNSTQGYVWDVRDINGGPGQGTIDASGLYRAPPKGALAERDHRNRYGDLPRGSAAQGLRVGDPGRPRPQAGKGGSGGHLPADASTSTTAGANNDMIDGSNKRANSRRSPSTPALRSSGW